MDFNMDHSHGDRGLAESGGRLSYFKANKIVELCMDVYRQLPKKGKPIPSEFTVLSSIIKIDTNQDRQFEVISLGTGTKCIGTRHMCSEGLILNDLHAEVIARRGFLIYLYDNIGKAFEGKDSIFTIENNLCKLKSGLKFAFFSSQIPCGDASIVPKDDSDDDDDAIDFNDIELGVVVTSRKRKHDEAGPSEEEDVHRTGAKCLPHDKQDPKGPGKHYHLLGQVRTKPGRGSKTLSVSCSDKIARWIHMGVQGSLINMLLTEPIYLSHIIFGNDDRYCEKALSRALLYRNNTNVQFQCKPWFYKCKIKFVDAKCEGRTRPTPLSIVWVKLTDPFHQVAVFKGNAQGVTKTDVYVLPKEKTLQVTKAMLFVKFIRILQNNEKLRVEILGDTKCHEAQYNKVKSMSKDYIKMWAHVKDNFFKVWTTKPDMWNFTIGEEK